DKQISGAFGRRFHAGATGEIGCGPLGSQPLGSFLKRDWGFSMKITFAAAHVALAIALTGCATGQQITGRTASGVIVSEDFESTPVGAIPAGFTKTGEVSVQEGVAHSGTHALQIAPAVRGGRFISLAPDKVAALGGEHWGRLYYKVKTPTPMPTGRL